LLSAGLRVTFLAPVVLRGAACCTSVVMRIWRSATATAYPIEQHRPLPSASRRRWVTL